ncbi:hypothetical protein PPTG_18982 [Phytophthora nicotianae INRA-310]|uniref:Uncharacterized protein n=1 Tax=Phytophthora nicotianae (strain INRA-310) TaxID=761204 RepID=W2PE39_PHYN3|nr:hypothetical protein PPTG_18982 [Phytophthora nicotianae INRA-310]ETM99126.1 hypothetical protein PPTG_18982 [Phytophthora nicotianae INRA-310]
MPCRSLQHNLSLKDTYFGAAIARLIVWRHGAAFAAQLFLSVAVGIVLDKHGDAVTRSESALDGGDCEDYLEAGFESVLASTYTASEGESRSELAERATTRRVAGFATAEARYERRTDGGLASEATGLWTAWSDCTVG